MNEFDLIREFFANQPVRRDDVALGIGDDAAVLDVPAGQQLVVSTDMLVGGVHFPETTDARSVGHKALAVNLSDLAAMGADPAWFTLNLSLPAGDPAWLREFCAGMFDLASEWNVALVGGDTTKGPLSLGIQIMGFVPRGAALTRSGARPGDRIYVTGNLGDAALGLQCVLGQLKLSEQDRAAVLSRLNRPIPRIEAGRALRGLASACIDLSDGLIADLGHILESSNVGARIQLSSIPLSSTYQSVFQSAGWQSALAGGDDYELCFALPPQHHRVLESVSGKTKVPFQCIGEIEAAPGLRIVDEHGGLFEPAFSGYDHFRAD